MRGVAGGVENFAGTGDSAVPVSEAQTAEAREASGGAPAVACCSEGGIAGTVRVRKFGGIHVLKNLKGLSCI